MRYIAYWQSQDMTKDVGSAKTLEDALAIARRRRPSSLYVAAARRANIDAPVRDHETATRYVWHSGR